MLKYPNLREEMIRYVRIMADPMLARSIWVEKKYDPPTVYDSFTEAIGFFFDETSVGIKEQSIGWIVYDEQEYEAIQALMNYMGIVLDKVGGGYAPDDEYLERAEWQNVVTAAKNALQILEQHET
jgi:hypothetical protein